MRYLKRNSIITAFWAIQIVFLQFGISGFDWLPSLLAGCILVSIIIDIKSHFTALFSVFLQLFVTILYVLGILTLIAMFGWDKAFMPILCIIIINLWICIIRRRWVRERRHLQ